MAGSQAAMQLEPDLPMLLPTQNVQQRQNQTCQIVLSKIQHSHSHPGCPAGRQSACTQQENFGRDLRTGDLSACQTEARRTRKAIL